MTEKKVNKTNDGLIEKANELLENENVKKIEEKVSSFVENKKVGELVDKVTKDGTFNKIMNSNFIQSINKFVLGKNAGKTFFKIFGLIIMGLSVLFLFIGILYLFYILGNFNIYLFFLALFKLFAYVVLFVLGYALFAQKRMIISISVLYYILEVLYLFLSIYLIPYLVYLSIFAGNSMMFDPGFGGFGKFMVFIFSTILFTLFYGIYFVIIFKNKDKFIN